MINSNIDEILSKFNKLQDFFDHGLEQILEQWLQDVEKEAKSLAPIRTGFLRDNISSLGTSIANDVIKGSVASAAQYSSFLEFGTIKMSAKPFLKPALENKIDELVNRIRNKIEEIF